MEELISIILPVYNGEKFLQAAIESCLRQTYTNFELIIVDDCSTDDSNVIARNFADLDERIILIRNAENKKLPSSLNVGHKAAKGRYITWTSDDNLFQKDALFQLHKAIKGNKAKIVYSNYLHINLKGELTGSTYLKPIEYLLYDNVIGPCFLYEKEVYEKCGGFNPDHFLIEDFEFWLKAAAHFHFYKIENPGYYFYRLHDQSLSGKMEMDLNLRNQFEKNKVSFYNGILGELDLINKDLVLDYFKNRYKEDRFEKQIPFLQKNFMQDIEKISNHFKAFYNGKLENIVLEDAVNNILITGSWQKPLVLFKLHREAGFKLLNLPARKYLSLVKKCIFN